MCVEKLLREELEQEIGELGNLTLGSDEYKSTVDGVSKLMDKLNDSNKIELDAQERAAARESEAELKMEQIENDKKNRRSQVFTTIAGIVIPVAVTIWGTLTTLKFEETGTVTTTAGKKLTGRLFDKK